MDERHLKIHTIVARSRANGPGWRTVVWVQGCTLNCPGCFNPQTHDPGAGRRMSVDQVLAQIDAADDIDGLTITGGEPLQQVPAVTRLLEAVRRRTPLSIVLFTGYTFEHVLRRPDAEAMLACIDVLVAGPYDSRQPAGTRMLGSSNQTVHLLTDTYRTRDLDEVPCSEVMIDPDGLLTISGIDPIRMT